MSNNLVEIRNNQVVVSSRQVAEKFGKEHRTVLRSLSTKLCGANKDRLSQHFYKDTYKDSTGKSNTIYYMDRDGFSFLVMGFTGEKADKWKLDFIEAFNTMEKNSSKLKVSYQTLMTLWLLLVHGQMQWKPNRKHY